MALDTHTVKEILAELAGERGVQVVAPTKVDSHSYSRRDASPVSPHLELRVSTDYHGPNGVYVSLHPTRSVLAIGGEKELGYAERVGEHIDAPVVYHQMNPSGLR